MVKDQISTFFERKNVIIFLSISLNMIFYLVLKGTASLRPKSPMFMFRNKKIHLLVSLSLKVWRRE